MATESGQLLPGLAAVGRAEQRGVFDAGVDHVRIGRRWFEMPDPLELPWVRRAVVPLVSARDAVVGELVAHRLPAPATVVRSLNHLPEPAGGLRRVQPIRIRGRSLEVVDLPARKVGAADVPPFALPVRRQDEGALACANQYPYLAHLTLLPECCRSVRLGIDSPAKTISRVRLIPSPDTLLTPNPCYPLTPTPYSLTPRQK